jgi:hypothetical protein
MNMSENTEKMTKPMLLKSIQEEHSLLEMTLARLNHSQMLINGVEGEWSVKDILGHISAWERRMISWTGSLLRNEQPEVPLPWDVDRMNAETYCVVKDKPLADVLEEYRQSYWDSLSLVDNLSEEQLQTSHPDTWPMGLLWTGIAANMNWHYKEHRENIQSWLATRKQER